MKKNVILQPIIVIFPLKTMKSHLGKIANWYFTKHAAPYWCVFLCDLLIVWLSLMLVYVIHNGWVATGNHIYQVIGTTLVYLVPYIVGFKIFHTYSGVLRYSGFVDLGRVAAAILFGTAVVVAGRMCLSFDDIFVTISSSELFAAFLLSLTAMWGVRIIIKFLFDNFFAITAPKRAFVYGIKSGAVALAKSIRNSKPTEYYVRGFVSPDGDLVGKQLLGREIYSEDEIEDAIRTHSIDTLFVSPLVSGPFRQKTELQNRLLSLGVNIFMLPVAKEWKMGDDLSYSNLKKVDICDLLPRNEINVNLEEIKSELTGKCVLVTGAAGSIGGEMVRQIASFCPSQMVLVDQAETPMHDTMLYMREKHPEVPSLALTATICNAAHMETLFAKYRPTYVFHAAAYKHVPMMEDNPGECVTNNIGGTRIIADLAVKYGVRKFVMISTDKAVNPTNVMGCSKRICEMYCQSLNGREGVATQFVTTRFGNVLGSNGSVIPIFRRQIEEGGPVKVTHPDIIRYFMLIPEACRLVLEAGVKGHGGEIFVFDMGEPVRIADLAKRMISLSGAKNVRIEYTGLRFGEKLYEELLSTKENTLPSFHEKIRIAQVSPSDYDAVNADIDRLIETAQSYDDMEIVRRMKHMVPEFKSNNSKYEKLDRH